MNEYPRWMKHETQPDVRVDDEIQERTATNNGWRRQSYPPAPAAPGPLPPEDRILALEREANSHNSIINGLLALTDELGKRLDKLEQTPEPIPERPIESLHKGKSR